MLFRKVVLTSSELGIVIEYLPYGNLENHVRRCWPLQEVDARWSMLLCMLFPPAK